MIDLHCHILPGFDDGARHEEEAIDMAVLAARSGVSGVVATPHCIDGGTQEVLAGVRQLQQWLLESRVNLQIYPGMEIFGTEHTARLLQQGRLLTLNGSRYPLMEFDFVSDGQEETRILQSVLDAGYVPLVAHPERYQYVKEDPYLINLWTKMGCLLQVNKGSLLGRFGEGSRLLAMELVGRGFAAVVGSDAHYAGARTPWLYDVWDLLARQFEPIAARTLLQTNPGKIIKNQTISLEMPEWF